MGEIDGLLLGLAEGESDGESVGPRDGVSDGLLVGGTDRMLLGEEDSCVQIIYSMRTLEEEAHDLTHHKTIQFFLTCADGNEEGSTEGAPLGVSKGAPLSPVVGVVDGDADGDTVMDPVGTLVITTGGTKVNGALDGDGVGMVKLANLRCGRKNMRDNALHTYSRQSEYHRHLQDVHHDSFNDIHVTVARFDGSRNQRESFNIISFSNLSFDSTQSIVDAQSGR